jgi:hypothetical protein
LSEEERGYWLAIVSPFPPARFQADAMPTLIELVRAMGRSRKLAEELDGLRQTKLGSELINFFALTIRSRFVLEEDWDRAQEPVLAER